MLWQTRPTHRAASLFKSKLRLLRRRAMTTEDHFHFEVVTLTQLGCPPAILLEFAQSSWKRGLQRCQRHVGF
jgi:hypothetical protein